MATTQSAISKKRKFVADGVFYAELNEFFQVGTLLRRSGSRKLTMEYAAKVQNRGLSAVAQCESLRYKLLNGLAVRRACYGVLRFIMESGAKGCEVVVSGKLRAARAKSMKFTVRTTATKERSRLMNMRRTAS